MRSKTYDNSNGRLDGKDIVALSYSSALASQINDPYLLAYSTHVFSHAAERIPVEVARSADKADNAGPRRRFVFKNLP
jgi:hypothetical protein